MRLFLLAEIKSTGFEAEMSLGGNSQEFTKNMLKDLIDRSEIKFARVSKVNDPELDYAESWLNEGRGR